MSNFWEDRYKAGGNSGPGSYGKSADEKANVINDYIIKYNIKTISDFGCGDGNQISLLDGFEKYVGHDISPHIVNSCKMKFLTNKNLKFVMNMEELPDADLCTSLDVLYHIVDEVDFEYYMYQLFNKSKKCVLIYAPNHEDNNHLSTHYICYRDFTKWVNQNKKNFVLVDEFMSSFPPVKFFLYEKS